MGTLSALVDLARSALQVDQQALNATSNNVANQNTPGYTREVVNFETGQDSVTLSNGLQTATAPTAETTSVRDRVLEQRVDQATQIQASTAAQSAVLSQVEDVFGLSGSTATAGSTELGTSLNALFSSFTALSASPSNAATREAVLSAASAFSSNVNGAETQLSEISSSLNGGITTSLAAVNGLTASIAQLNTQIAEVSPNGDAGTLEDQRQNAISQLSQYIGLNQVTTERNGITLTTTGGTVLVAGSSSYQLSNGTSSGVSALVDATGANVTASVTGGSIGGALAAQSSLIPGVIQQLGSLAEGVASAVNAQNQAGLDGNGNPGTALFGISVASDGSTTLSVAATSGAAIAAAAVDEGATGTSNANALAALATGINADGLTFPDNLASLLGNIGTSASSLGDADTAQQATLTQLTTARDSLSGVSLDDEAANLTQYQRSYEAAAKLFSILDTIFASALNLGTETTVQ